MMSASTHIFNKLANARVSIYFLIREIQNKTCYAFYAQCTNKATKWGSLQKRPVAGVPDPQ